MSKMILIEEAKLSEVLEALEGNTTNPIIDPEQAAIEDKAITAIRKTLAKQPAIKRDLTPEQPAQQGCMRCNTPKKCALYGCSPLTWPAEQPAQQEPVAWLVCENWRKHSLFFTEEGAEDFKNAAQREDDLSGNLARWKAKPLYTSPPAQRKPLTDEWVPVTQSLLNEQHPWLYQPMWIAMKGGVVVQGYYEWRQGRNPDRFITDLGDEWAFNADFVMPITKPTPPAIEAAHGIKENT